MTLSAVQFLRRFLLHLLPKGFMRIRTYGFLANRHRRAKLALCRRLITAAAVQTAIESHADVGPAAANDKLGQCPVCRRGRMACVLVLSSSDLAIASPTFALDTS